jgi:hypothetical protein
LKAAFDLPADIALPDDIESHRNPEGLDTFFEDAAVDNLKRWYSEDYRFAALCAELFSPARVPARGARR